MAYDSEEILAWAIIFLFFTILLSTLCTLWRILRTQRGILKALEAANQTNAQTLETLKDIRNIPAAVDEGLGSAQDDEDDEAPADFVYCPECSTRVEVDPSIRDINVVCPDCKKPFHIH